MGVRYGYTKAKDLVIGDVFPYGRDAMARITGFCNLVDKSRRGIQIEVLQKDNTWKPYDAHLQYKHDHQVVAFHNLPT
jgi:hypothetical protein